MPVPKNFDVVEVKQVAANNEKLYVNRAEGFIGYGKDMKKEELVGECSDIDDIIAFTKEGNLKIVRSAEKVFSGPHRRCPGHDLVRVSA